MASSALRPIAECGNELAVMRSAVRVPAELGLPGGHLRERQAVAVRVEDFHVAHAVAVGFHGLVLDACAASRARMSLRSVTPSVIIAPPTRAARTDRSSITTHAFAPTCHRYSSPMTSSAGRPKNTSNHFCDVARSRTHTTLYRSTRTLLPADSRTETMAATETHRRPARG